jgi:glycosyltransferase 2 family protein
MRKLIIAIALMLGVYFIIGKIAELQAIVDTLKRGDLRFIFLALLVELLWLVNQAASYRSIYRLLGIPEDFRNLIVMAAAANFVNVVAPSVGVGGIAVFVSQARRSGYSSARVMAAGVLFVLFEYLGFLIVLALGLVVLVRRNNLTAAELTASTILVIAATAMGVLVYLGVHSSRRLGDLLAWLARQVNRLLKPVLRHDYLSEARAHAFAVDVAAGLYEVRNQRGSLVQPAVLAVSSKILLILILSLMFLAFEVPFTLGVLVAGFSIGYLFLIVSPTPAGIGFVEGALTLALNSLNVPLGAAAVLTAAYRGITFWAPLLGGMLAFRWLSRESALTTIAQ